MEELAVCTSSWNAVTQMYTKCSEDTENEAVTSVVAMVRTYTGSLNRGGNT